MTGGIQFPIPGEPMRASWARAVTDAVNCIPVMSPSGMLVRDFPGGRGFQPLPTNVRFRSAGGGLAPFAVRYVKESDADPSIDYDGWEIYMPNGCVSVGSTCRPMNPAAYRLNANGERTDQPGWFRMSAPALEGEDGDNWEVVVHAKCSAAISGVDAFEDWPKHYAWAEIRKSDRTQEEREEDVNDVGDAFETVTGVVTWREVEGEDGETRLVWSFIPSVRTPILMTYTRPNFEIFTAFTVDAEDDDVSLSFDRIFIRNMMLSAAGATFMADGMTELEKDDEEVYLKITALTSPYTAEIKAYKSLSVEGETLSVPSQIADEKEDGEIYELLYVLKNGHVVANNLASLQNIQLYQ